MPIREVMYVGRKTSKRDNVNNEPNRIWRGLGDVLKLSDVEANKLTQPNYAEIWMDVTEKTAKERTKIIETLRDKYRAEQAAVTPAASVARALNVLSTDDLEAELRRRRKTDGKADQNEMPPLVQKAAGNNRINEKEDAERPNSTDDVVQDAAGAVATLDPANREHFDTDGKPVLGAVVNVLGYKISQDELNAAVDLLKN